MLTHSATLRSGSRETSEANVVRLPGQRRETSEANVVRPPRPTPRPPTPPAVPRLPFPTPHSPLRTLRSRHESHQQSPGVRPGERPDARRGQQPGPGVRRRRRRADLHRPGGRGLAVRPRRQPLPRLHPLVGPDDPRSRAPAGGRGGRGGPVPRDELRGADRGRERAGRADRQGGPLRSRRCAWSTRGPRPR